jgi:ectoine hydroxylase-related dioxygenase (phytanoyl-CoA dioxygenase family)
MSTSPGFSNPPAKGIESASRLDGLRESYSKDGYVVVKRLFSPARLSSLRQSLMQVLEKAGREGGENSLNDLILKQEASDHNAVYQAAQSVGSSAATYQLLGSSMIFDFVSELTGFKCANLHLMPMYLIIQIPSDERFDYTWHQDGSYYPWCQDFLTLWFPVNRGTGRDTGTISMIPGSQQYGPRETETFLRHGYFKQIESKLTPFEKTREQVLEVDLGDCCIMNGNTVHRSVANRSATPRVAGVLRIASLHRQTSYERERFYCVHKS